MSKSERYARVIIKRTNISSLSATTAPSNDHTLASPQWSNTDIYKGEFFINLEDEKLWIRTDHGIKKLLFEGDVASGGTSTDYYVVEGEYDSGSSTLYLRRNDGNTVTITGITSGGGSGTSGTSGTDGTSGTSGIDGTSGTDGTSGSSGTDGTSGTSGIYGGNSMLYKFSTGTTMDEPGDGYLKLSNSILASATGLSIDNYNYYGNNIIDWLDSFQPNGTSIIRIYKENDPSIFVVYQIGSKNENSGYFVYGIETIDGNGTFNNEDNLVITYTEGGSGTSGTDGTSGSSGTSGTDGTSGSSGTSGTSGAGVISGGTDGQVLVKDGIDDYDTKWVDQDDVVTALSALTDTTINFPQTGQTLIYSGDTWVNAPELYIYDGYFAPSAGELYLERQDGTFIIELSAATNEEYYLDDRYARSLTGLTDVNFEGLEQNDNLIYSGNTWVNDKSSVNQPFTGSTTAITISVNHNFGIFPDVIVYDSDGYEIEGNVRNLNFNSIEVSFNNFNGYGNIICKK